MSVPTERKVKCPLCSGRRTRMVDSRFAKREWAIRRRRECFECKHRWTTYERIDVEESVPIKNRIAAHVTGLKALCDDLLEATK